MQLPDLPAPVLSEHDGIVVVRDDMLQGGTKRRILRAVVAGIQSQEFVYASPAYGYAQVALAHTCKELGRRAVIFTAQRKDPHRLTLAAQTAGARIIMVPHGYLNVVQARARDYCKKTGAHYLPFGVDTPDAIEALADVARGMNLTPAQVWTVAGSGVLSRALQRAWPGAEFHAVQIGRSGSDIGRARRWVAPEKFEDDARVRPPFPSCRNYDAKAWQFIRQHAASGALFWNVGA